MTATQTQIRRGTSAQCDSMTPAEGEVIADLTNDRLRLGDGIVQGGKHQASAADVQNNAFVAAVAGGTANALTLTVSPAPSGYATHMSFKFRAALDNTSTATINVNTLGARNLRKSSGGSIVALDAGDLVAGVYYTITYDGTNFIVENLAPAQQGFGLEFIAEASPSGGYITFTTGVNSALYGDYKLILGDVSSSPANYRTFLQTSTDGGSTWTFFQTAPFLDTATVPSAASYDLLAYGDSRAKYIVGSGLGVAGAAFTLAISDNVTAGVPINAFRIGTRQGAGLGSVLTGNARLYGYRR